MVTFIYRCPATGYRLEGRQAAPAAASPIVTYVAEHCVACGGLHIVNPATGRLMSEERTRPAPGLAAQATARGGQPPGPAPSPS
jgi:hypothetical protein